MLDHQVEAVIDGEWGVEPTTVQWTCPVTSPRSCGSVPATLPASSDVDQEIRVAPFSRQDRISLACGNGAAVIRARECCAGPDGGSRAEGVAPRSGVRASGRVADGWWVAVGGLAGRVEQRWGSPFWGSRRDCSGLRGGFDGSWRCQSGGGGDKSGQGGRRRHGGARGAAGRGGAGRGGARRGGARRGGARRGGARRGGARHGGARHGGARRGGARRGGAQRGGRGKCGEGWGAVLHHVEVWVPELGRAVWSWGWLLGELGWVPYREWAVGRSWRFGETYIVVEESPAVTAARQ